MTWYVKTRSAFPSLTAVLVLVNVTAYFYTSILGGNFVVTNLDVLVKIGQYNKLVFEGWYWQLITSMFVHVSLVHLVGNMFFLVIFGLRAEDLFKNLEYFLIYFSSGLAGNLLTLLMGTEVISAGASGAIFGLFGACTIYMRKTIGGSIAGALIYSFLILIIASTSPRVNLLAHFGGLIAGLVIGYLIARNRKFVVVYRYSYEI